MKRMKIENAEGGKIVATIRGAIGWDVFAEDFRRALSEAEGNSLEVRIDSCGGDVVEAIGIFNAIRGFKGDTVAVIDGVAMSAASYIMLACKTVRAFENSVIMIHNVSCGARGNADDLEHAADVCRKFESVILAEYVARTGKSEEEIQALLDKETYLTATEAKELGLVDEVVKSGPENAARLKLVAMERLENFRRFSGNRETSKKKNEGNKDMEIKTIEELISALEAFAEKVADETLKEEIAAITEAAKGLAEPAEPGEPGDDGKGDEGAAAEASRRREIADFAKEVGNSLLDSLTIEALAGNMSVQDYKGKACKMLAEVLKNAPQASLLAAAQVNGGGKPKMDVFAEYKAICESGDIAKRREFFAKHKSELIYK